MPNADRRTDTQQQSKQPQVRPAIRRSNCRVPVRLCLCVPDRALANGWLAAVAELPRRRVEGGGVSAAPGLQRIGARQTGDAPQAHAKHSAHRG
jgi:hypothetical protein